MSMERFEHLMQPSFRYLAEQREASIWLAYKTPWSLKTISHSDTKKLVVVSTRLLLENQVYENRMLAHNDAHPILRKATFWTQYDETL
jgi:hypothetical protein